MWADAVKQDCSEINKFNKKDCWQVADEHIQFCEIVAMTQLTA